MTEQRARDMDLADKCREIDRKRVSAGLCRHCGGPIPCRSMSGDYKLGRRHTPATMSACADAERTISAMELILGTQL